MIDREKVYEGLTTEDKYAQGWGDSKTSKDSETPDHMVNRHTGLPFSEMEWIVFAEKYINEAKLGYANYTPDLRTTHIRMLKAASLLVSGLQACNADIDSIAGVSSTKFPINTQGLKDLDKK